MTDAEKNLQGMEQMIAAMQPVQQDQVRSHIVELTNRVDSNPFYTMAMSYVALQTLVAAEKVVGDKL